MKFFYSFLLALVVCTAHGQFMPKEKLPEFKPWKKGQWLPPGERKVHVKADSISLGDLFISIWNQVQMHAFFIGPILNTDSMLKADFNDTPLDSVLTCLLGSRGLEWKYYVECYVIREREETEKKSTEASKRNQWIPPGVSEAVRKNKTMAAGSDRNMLKGRHTGEKIWLRQPKISEVRSFEQKIGSSLEFEDTGMPSDFYPFKKKYPISLTPLTAERWEVKSHLPICAHYYYTPSDSIVRLITYDWLRYYESVYADDQEKELLDEEKRILREEDGKKGFYKSEFERIKGLCIQKLGPPTFAAANELQWDKPGFNATLKLTFKPYMHYIRLKVYWK